MNPIHLGGIVKRAYPDFNMLFFRNRLRLQKFIYLMQAYDINLGYNFRLYLRGPYSSALARDGFEIPKINKVSQLKFEDETKEKRFLDFLKFLGNNKDNEEWLEIASSLHLFRRLYPEETEKEIIERVRDKDVRFKDKEKEIAGVLKKLKGGGIYK